MLSYTFESVLTLQELRSISSSRGWKTIFCNNTISSFIFVGVKSGEQFGRRF